MQIAPIGFGGDPSARMPWTGPDGVARSAWPNGHMTITLGVVLLAEAVLRVATVYSQPEHAVLKASLLSQAPAIGLLVLWFIIARLAFVPLASKEVDVLMPRA